MMNNFTLRTDANSAAEVFSRGYRLTDMSTLTKEEIAERIAAIKRLKPVAFRVVDSLVGDTKMLVVATKPRKEKNGSYSFKCGFYNLSENN